MPKTWLDPEEKCYPSGGRLRRGKAIAELTGELVPVWAGIPDTFFSIPCTARMEKEKVEGFLYFPHNKEDGEYYFCLDQLTLSRLNIPHD